MSEERHEDEAKHSHHKKHSDKRSDSETKSQEIEALSQQLATAEKQVSEHWERILRMQAESENAARRAERDVSHAHKYALEKFALELLPIIDSLELCITSAPAEMQKTEHAVLEGVKLTLKMFYAAMEKFGIEAVNPLNEPFDPHFQQAISTQDDPKAKPGTVLSVLQKGYTLNKRLLRPALVVVAKAES